MTPGLKLVVEGQRTNRTGLRVTAAYLKELSELQIVEMLLIVVAKVQADELAVPVERDVVVHCGLAEDVPHVLCSTKERKNVEKGGKKEVKKQKNM